MFCVITLLIGKFSYTGARMARRLRHGATFDEFGSTLDSWGVYKLCMGMRKIVVREGLGNGKYIFRCLHLHASCGTNTQVETEFRYKFVNVLGLCFRGYFECGSLFDTHIPAHTHTHTQSSLLRATP